VMDGGCLPCSTTEQHVDIYCRPSFESKITMVSKGIQNVEVASRQAIAGANVLGSARRVTPPIGYLSTIDVHQLLADGRVELLVFL
jgi:hypothetical protein